MKSLRLVSVLAMFFASSPALFAQPSDHYAQIKPLEVSVNAGTASRADQLALARLYMLDGRYYEASKIADRLLALDPGDTGAVQVRDEAAKGLRDVQDRKLAEAEALAKKGNATDEDRLALSNAYFEAGQYGSAADAYARLPESLRTRDVRLRQARSYAWGGQMDRAEQAYSALLREQSDPDLELEYGRLLSWMGSSKLSLETLTRVYQTNKSEPVAVALANAMAWSGDREGALRMMSDYVASHPDAALAQKLLAELQVSPELRLERVGRLIELEPYNLAIRMEQARLNLDAGHPAEALKTIRFVEEHRTSDIEGLADLRRRAEEARKTELAKAGERLRALDGRNPQSADEILALAKAYTGLEEYRQAISLYRDYLKIRPDDVEARVQYARVLSWNQNWRESERQYELLLQQNPERADLRLEYGQVLSYSEHYVDAIKTFRTLTDLSGNPRAHLYSDVPTRSHFQLGQIYRWYGWNDHAVAEQNSAIALDSSYAPARTELDLVRHLRPASTIDARYSYSHDSEDFTLRRVDFEGLKWTAQRTSLSLALGHHWFEQLGEQAEANVVGLGGQYRGGDRWLARARAGVNFYDNGYGSRPFLGIGAEWLPSIQSRVALDLNHYDLVYDVFTLRSLAPVVGTGRLDPLTIDDLRAHYDYNTGGHWSLLADGSAGRISDHNQRLAAHGELAYRIFKEPFVAVKADARWLQHDFRTSRYWSPTDYHSYAGVLHVGQNVRNRFFWSAEGKLGRSWEEGRTSDIRAYDLTLTVPLTDALDLFGNYGYGKSGRIDSILGSGNGDVLSYWQRHYYVGLRVKRLFAGEDRRRGRDSYYYEPINMTSPAIPPPGETR
jgi:tetratricopeptide (TPR) repeat protein